MSITRKCKIEGCEGKYLATGYCGKHYHRKNYIGDLYGNTVFDARPAIIEGDIAKIPVGINAKDGYTIVDKEFAWLDKYKWRIRGGYAMGTIVGRPAPLHHLIVGKPLKGLVVDHINRNPLDNRRENLRIVTQAINNLNTGIRKDSKSGHKNVTWSKQASKWVVVVRRQKNSTYLGQFDTIESAVKARDIFLENYNMEGEHDG